MGGYGLPAPVIMHLTYTGQRPPLRLYYDLDDILGEDEHSRTPDSRYIQFDGHGLRRVTLPGLIDGLHAM